MSAPKVSATKGSVAIGGDVAAPVINVNADNSSPVNISLEQKVDRELPSFLGAMIVFFSRQSLSEYGLGPRRILSAEVLDKLKHNMLPAGHPLIRDYRRYVLLLDQAYLGVEQKNSDARYLVRRKAGIAYQAEIMDKCRESPDAQTEKVIDYVRAHVNGIIENVLNRLLDEYKASSSLKVEAEIAHLGVSLIVADSIIECEVLERP